MLKKYKNGLTDGCAGTATPKAWSVNTTGLVAAHQFRNKLWVLGRACTGRVKKNGRS